MTTGFQGVLQILDRFHDWDVKACEIQELLPDRRNLTYSFRERNNILLFGGIWATNGKIGV